MTLLTKSSATGSSYSATHAKRFNAVAVEYQNSLSKEEPTEEEIEEQWQLLSVLPGAHFPARASQAGKGKQQKTKKRRKSQASESQSSEEDGSDSNTVDDEGSEELSNQLNGDKKLLRIMLNIAYMR